jgi:plastocyanin
MRHHRPVRVASLLLLSALAGCTPGAPPAGTGSAAVATTTIDVSLTSATVSTTAFGSAAGFTPVVTNVALGTTVRFVNVDGITHTASSFAGTAFPSPSPLGAAALNLIGNTLSNGWSSGTLGPGTTSQVLLADSPGIYLYGCFFHYSSATPMRGAIVVK